MEFPLSPLMTDADIITAKQMKKDFKAEIAPPKSEYMTQHEYFMAFEAVCKKMLATTQAKNADYAGSNDAFKNFRAIEIFTNGRISVEDGIIVRLTDKFTRIINLLTQEAKVKDEAITDTLIDMAVYSIILKIYIEQKNDNRRNNP